MRVNELAKELGVSSKDLLARLKNIGFEVKSHSSSVPPEAMPKLHAAAAPAPTPLDKAAPKQESPAPPPAAKPPRPEPAAPRATPAPKPPRQPAPPEPKPAAPSAQPAVQTPAKPKPQQVVKLRGAVVIKDLAELFGVRPNQLIARLMQMNVLASINERVEFNVARDVGLMFGFDVVHERRGAEQHVLVKRDEEAEVEDKPEDLMPRPPVVTFLGHVDHGKTSLMDRIRNTAVAAGESGGITQHIGAYTVEVGGRQITFLDTPGHAAFTAMRARGANMTDIAVIVIAADDGIMPQTREAIQHARAAEVAMMVAINKIDLPTANADRVRQQLQGENLSPEEWGGDVICCEVSAQTGKGVEHLLEMILLQADMLELRANPARRARGYVIEARLEPGKGPTANLLVATGSLNVGDPILCGPHWGRVRALLSDHGCQLKKATPSIPVKCLGLSGVPEAGAEFRVCAKERTARDEAEKARMAARAQQSTQPKKVSLESLFSQLSEAGRVELKLVLKADTQGSVEAISHALKDIKSQKVSLNMILSGTGNITVNDVMLASASDAVVMGFHVPREPGVDAVARHEGVEIRLHSIIYELLDEVREAMTGLLAPQYREQISGRAEVKQLFGVGKNGVVAGCLMVEGRVTPKHRVRVKRASEVLFEGSIMSLRHFQQDVAEIREAQECGIRLDNYAAFAPGDILEFYLIEEIEQTL